MKQILVAGATGYLGGYVVKELKNQGYQTRALARSSKKLESLGSSIDQVFVGEVTDPNSIDGICEGIDVVFSSIGITKQKDKLSYYDVDYQANLNLLEKAEKAGVKKFIYVSVFNTDNMKSLRAVQAKIMFEKALKNSGIDYTIIYPNGFYSDMMEYLSMAKKGKGFVFGSGESKINPIHGLDLAEICVKAVHSPEKEIHVGGPEVLSHNQILEMAFSAVGKPAKTIRIPLRIKNMTISLLRTFTSMRTYGPLEFFMTVLAEDMIAPKHGHRLLKDFFQEQLKLEVKN